MYVSKFQKYWLAFLHLIFHDKQLGILDKNVWHSIVSCFGKCRQTTIHIH